MPGGPFRKSDSLRKILVPALLLVIPFIFFAAYVLPDSISFSRKIGNDFPILYLSYKSYLLNSLAQLRIPWWSPSEASGYPFYSNPFAQVFYPLNIPLVLYMKVTGGYTYTDHQAFTILGVSIFLLGAYGWLKCLRFSTIPSVAGALTAGMSYRMCEILRFPNAVQSAAWYPFILWGITLILLHDRKKAGFGLTLAGFIMLLTAGYPYYAYYSVFLVAAYALFLCLPSAREFFQAEKVHPLRRLFFLSIPFLIGLLVTLPYLYKIKWTMDQTQDRGGGELAWASSGFSFLEMVGSWIFPPSSLGEGWYYFGMIAFSIIAAYVLSFRYRQSTKSEKIVLISLGCWFVFVTAVSFGRTSPLFIALWYVMPGFSSLREWSRFNILQLPTIAILTALGSSWLIAHISRPSESSRSAPTSDKVHLLPSRLLPLWAAVFVIQIALLTTKTFNSHWVSWHGRVPYAAPLYIVAGFVGFFGLWLILRARMRRPLSSGATSLLVLSLISINLLDVFYVGNTLWSGRMPAEVASQFTLSESVLELTKKGFFTQRINNYNTISTIPHFNVGIINSWYYGRYTKFHEAYWGRNKDCWGPFQFRDTTDHNERIALAILMGMANGSRLLFTKSLAHNSPSSFIQDAFQTLPSVESAQVFQYTGDMLELSVQCNSPGYITFVDNWDPDWRAWIDGKRVPIKLAFGTFKSVALDPGSHVIRFKYAPFSSEIERLKGDS